MSQKFDRNAEYILEDERVLLSPLQKTDLRYLLPYALNEQDTWKYSGISAHGEERMSTYINTALTNREAGHLERGQAHTDHREGRAGADGHVGAAGQRAIQGAQNRQSRHIYRRKHNT